MTDVAVNIDYDPLFQPQYLPATFATTSAQHNPASFGGLDLITGEQSIESPFQSSTSIFDWSSLIAMTFQQFPMYQLDQDLNSHNNTSTSQQKNSNEMTATTAFSNQQYADVDTSNQQSTILQTPSFVEPPINYYPSTSTTTTPNSVILNDNSTNNYSHRNVYIENYPQQQQFLEQNYHACPTTHPSRLGITNPQLINYQDNLRQRIIYQGSSPTPTSTIGRQLHQKQIPGTIGSNVSNVSYSHSRPENVTSASITPNMIAFTPTSTSTMLVTPSLFDQSIFTTKPQVPQVPQTTITIPNSIGSSVSSSESTSPTKQNNYSYSGPPKSYYSRLPLYDRPFKCDTCPQSFNRNHDLKRHKRIHLAVKPYPCPCCEKQFSRKDALKRHILVKGCNNTHKGTTNNKRSNSPNSNTNKIVDDSSNSSGQKYDSSIESESPIKSEPTSDNGVRYI